MNQSMNLLLCGIQRLLQTNLLTEVSFPLFRVRVNESNESNRIEYHPCQKIDSPFSLAMYFQEIAVVHLPVSISDKKEQPLYVFLKIVSM